MKTGIEIAQLAQMASLLEVCAPKPGNVNCNHDFENTTFEDFLLSAIAIGPAFEKAGNTSVGQTILQATADTQKRVRSNTNLGMILLLAPLAKACSIDAENIRESLNAVLQSLTVEDTRLAYAAIRLAQPGGLGRVSQADVSEEPSITLLEAMLLAQDRDVIAREYATSYSIVFNTGLPALKKARSQSNHFPSAVVQAFLTILSNTPDTLIARKKGIETARKVSLWAGEALKLGGVFTPEGQASLAELDQALRDEAHALNPGATADLTAAAIFLALLEK